MAQIASIPWHYLAAVAHLCLAVLASAHILLTKRESSTAIAWVGVVWLAPMLGPILYFLLGINRVKRRAGHLPQAVDAAISEARLPTPAPAPSAIPTHLLPLRMLVHQVTGIPLTEGNQVTPLFDGTEAYPAMLEAIESARKTLALSTYIMNPDAAGKPFADALSRAVARGVEVRVLLDGLGAFYAFPTMVSRLRRGGVPVARFMSSILPWRMPYLNLRNHRKILVVDGKLGFTGGLNIQASNLDDGKGHQQHDVHFRVEGPAVRQMMAAFERDWRFATGEGLDGPDWFPPPTAAGAARLRGVPHGPDDDFQKLHWVMLGALGHARQRVRVVTPYFLPDQPLITALGCAALAGVEVDIVLPAKTNISLVQWAAMANLDELLDRGCRIWRVGPAFHHTKLFVVDGAWSLLGSTNWDARSLRLNFEFNLECYDQEVAARLDKHIEGLIASSKPITLAEVKGRRLVRKFRDAGTRLLEPYL